MIKPMHDRKIFAGAKLRNIRQAKELTQREFAQLLDISASYLNQLENNQRPISAAVILALMNKFGIEIASLATDDDERFAADLHEALADPLFAKAAPSRQEINSAITNSPEFTKAFLALHRSYQSLKERIAQYDSELLSDATGVEPQPYEEVRDYFHYHDNYFDELDRAGERRAEEAAIDGTTNKEAALERLATRHGISVTFERRGMALDEISDLDMKRRLLRINAGMPGESQSFHLWHRIAEIEDREIIDGILGESKLHSREAREVARIALGNFAAGATVMPYRRFLAAARDRRHDIEILAADFGASLEQVAHRLSTLQRPGAPGVPFYFVRVDRAGTITKRHSATRLQFPRFSGACPLWNVHQAFETPGEIVRQLAETPDGERYISVARTITKRSRGYRAPIRRYAIALGSPVAYARSIIYADDLAVDQSDAYDLIGLSCRLCERENCPQRSVPPTDRKILVDSRLRKVVPFKIG
ncbi:MULTISPECIES: helix-turn-helix domain-containing protein [Albidovulum]|nr:short-chain fatty acyl-CoA regulator family protein [Defluviimonas sp. WL0024]